MRTTEKTLVKTKIVLEDDGKTLVTYFWRKTFLCFGYWYVFGCSSGSVNRNEERISRINDNTVSKVLFDNFISGIE